MLQPTRPYPLPHPTLGRRTHTQRATGSVYMQDTYISYVTDTANNSAKPSKSFSQQGQLPDPRELLDGKRPCRLPDGHAADSPRCAGRNDHERLYGFQQPHRPAQPCLYGTQPQYGRPGSYYGAPAPGANETWLDLAFHKIKKEMVRPTNNLVEKDLHLTKKSAIH